MGTRRCMGLASKDASPMHRRVPILLAKTRVGPLRKQELHRFVLALQDSVHEGRLTARPDLVDVLARRQRGLDLLRRVGAASATTRVATNPPRARAMCTRVTSVATQNFE